MKITAEMIEHCAKAIARDVPCSDGGRWNHGCGYDFPGEYSAAERRLIRGLARTCLDAAASLCPQEIGEPQS
jgi:hypothetical protein